MIYSEKITITSINKKIKEGVDKNNNEMRYAIRKMYEVLYFEGTKHPKKNADSVVVRIFNDPNAYFEALYDKLFEGTGSSEALGMYDLYTATDIAEESARAIRDSCKKIIPFSCKKEDTKRIMENIENCLAQYDDDFNTIFSEYLEKNTVDEMNQNDFLRVVLAFKNNAGTFSDIPNIISLGRILGETSPLPDIGQKQKDVLSTLLRCATSGVYHCTPFYNECFALRKSFKFSS